MAGAAARDLKLAAGGPDVYHVVVGGRIVTRVPLPREIADMQARKLGGTIQLYRGAKG